MSTALIALNKVISVIIGKMYKTLVTLFYDRIYE